MFTNHLNKLGNLTLILDMNKNEEIITNKHEYIKAAAATTAVATPIIITPTTTQHQHVHVHMYIIGILISYTAFTVLDNLVNQKIRRSCG